MFGRKCSLCNGKLDSNNICKECGLDNTKSDKYYKINQSSCDDMPLTHVHKDNRYDGANKKTLKTKQKAQYQKKPTKQKKQDQQRGKKGKLSALISIIVVLCGLIPSLIGIFGEITDTSYETESYNPYEYLEVEHPEEGEYRSYMLESGQYIVGVHIAEGDYKATVNDDFDTVQVEDRVNGLYLYEYPDKEDNYLEDLRLFYGAKVTITAETEIVLESFNAQPDSMVRTMENPIKDSYRLEKEYEARAGLDFEAGVYDVYTDADYAYITLTIVEEDGTEWEYYGNWEIGYETDKGEIFRNMVLPEGVKIYCQEAEVELIPSAMIGDYDYSRYYY